MRLKNVMRVTVKLFASLVRYSAGSLPGTPFLVSLPESSCVQQLVDKLGIPGEETKVAFVNGLIRDMDWVLQPEDEVGLFPPIGGG